MDLTLKDDASHAFTVVLKDKFGEVATAMGPLTVTSSDETVAVGTLSADQSLLTVAPAGAGKLGAAVITVADQSDNLSAVVNVTIVAGSPASIELTETPAPTAAAPAAAVAEASTSATPASDATAADAAPASSEPVAQ